MDEWISRLCTGVEELWQTEKQPEFCENRKFICGNEMLIRSIVGESERDGVAVTRVAFSNKARVLYEDRGRHENRVFSSEARK